MTFFEKSDYNLLFRYDGECVMLTPWGQHSLRVRSSILSDIADGSIALQTPEGFSAADVRITIADERHASIKNGHITAELFVQEWGNLLQITYRNQHGDILLREIAGGGALSKKARKFKPLPGGNFRLTVSFESNPEEKIYGMGQYQQERMNLKGCKSEAKRS